jgi:4,5-dihydroxyphthalate decarboxylase
MSADMREVTTLRTVLATPAMATPLRQGTISSPRVRFDFVDVKPVHDAFTPMVMEQPYDLCELAIVSCLQAIDHRRPIVMLPVVVASRFQRRCLIAYPPRGVPSAADLAGKRIGVRAYTQTTGMWVRAHLTEDYGLATASIHWITQKPSHVEAYHDPSFVECVGSERSLLDMLRDGAIDAAILGNDLPKGDEFAPVIDDAAARDLAWWQQHGFMPINHMMVVSRELSRRDPGAVAAAYELLAQAYERNTVPAGTPNPLRLGFDALRGPVQWTIDACLEQGLLSRRLTLDEVFGPAGELLAGLPA